jgi:hypothetical protein
LQTKLRKINSTNGEVHVARQADGHNGWTAIFVAVSVILGEKYGDEYFIIIFFNYRLNPKILSCFSPNLTPGCERCVLT